MFNPKLLLIGVGSLAAILLLQNWIRKLPIGKHLYKTNDIVGFYVNLIGVIYAVIMTFMLVVVWEQFEDASRLVEVEANALKNIYHLAGGLPAPARQRLRREAQEYAETVIYKEWPMMARNRADETETHSTLLLWDTVLDFSPSNMHEQTLQDQLLTQREALHDNRQKRLHEARRELPDILWLLLIVGGFITVGLCALFGVERRELHLLKTTVLGVLILLVLFCIWELDLPFSRDIVVDPSPFKQALKQFQEIGS
ncbi:MAG TPA: DUF4239 domain-containing protein [Chthonomonadaceae bacterium]|nr:DUF4239 domain-containing protein [Chthonomonadaceae bacterium]